MIEIVLNQDDLGQLSSDTLAEIEAIVFGGNKSVTMRSETTDDMFVEFSSGQARAFLSGCGPKIKAALMAMVEGEDRFFQLRNVASAVDARADGLIGIWSGITRRTRTITGQPESYMISWTGEQEYNEDGEYVDERGELTQMTYESFRKAFSLD